MNGGGSCAGWEDPVRWSRDHTDEGDGPMYLLSLGLSDDVLVFGDGSAMTFFEVTGGA